MTGQLSTVGVIGHGGDAEGVEIGRQHVPAELDEDKQQNQSDQKRPLESAERRFACLQTMASAGPRFRRAFRLPATWAR